MVLIFLIVWKMCEGNEILTAVVVILAAVASAIYWNARPYLLTFLIFALMYFLLDRYYRRGNGKLWLLPVLMVLWVNSHGGFLGRVYSDGAISGRCIFQMVGEHYLEEA